jgi:hypothetical protein
VEEEQDMEKWYAAPEPAIPEDLVEELRTGLPGLEEAAPAEVVATVARWLLPAGLAVLDALRRFLAFVRQRTDGSLVREFLERDR